MSDDHGNRKERRSSFFIATFYTVAACIYLWIWLFNGLDMGSGWVGPFGSILFGVCAIMSWLWHVKTLPPATQEKIMPVIGWAATAIGFGCIILGVMMVVVPLFQQGQAWLEFGEAPPRDLYWFFADAFCAETGGVGRGWEGKDICRDEGLFSSDWIGFNKIIGFVMGMHTALVFFIASVGLYVLALLAIASLER